MKLKPEEIREMISSGRLTVTVVGLGWMGLPLACLFADAGAKVLGVDKNRRLVEKINRAEATIDEPRLPQLVAKHVNSGKLRALDDVERAVSVSDVVVVTVPTSVDAEKQADYSILDSSCREIGRGLLPGALVILMSTVAPNVTERLVKPALEKSSGLLAGEDFGLAYSPIRAMGGRALRDLQEYRKVVGGLDQASLKAASAVLSTIVKAGLIETSNIKTAEATKLFEAVYRDLNIALANELGLYCERAGIDYFEAMEAANTQPYSHLHFPSIGVGGHCLPLYPYMLQTDAQTLGFKLRLIKAARRINDEMPRHVMRLASSGLRQAGRSLPRARVTVLGISYRANVKEARYSPAIELIDALKRRGSRVVVYDPKFTYGEVRTMGFDSEATFEAAVSEAECVILTVGHDEFKSINPENLAALTSKGCVVVDAASVLDPKTVEKVGLIYRGVGRGVWTR
ncbi:nucleotide sugar dehydrogenase [Candidatus Bathyarchaeota archaeon]|nr:nucleotide sugar dehydrogenase [Candidatus Bathyarchaeota archaeon]